MNNPRMTTKERNLLKGAIRRVFSRSELRRAALAQWQVEYHDPNRPRVKKWTLCPGCQIITPTYLMQVDHIEPIIPLNRRLEDMSWDEVINRAWCEFNNLQPLCKPCHKTKTKEEAKKRRSKKKNG